MCVSVCIQRDIQVSIRVLRQCATCSEEAMATRCLSTCFGLYVLLSLLTHLAELALSGLLAYELYRDDTHRDVFFALTAGVLIIPLVTIQLVSAVFLLRRRGDSMTGGEAALMAALHVLQLGFIWRHVAVLRERDVLVKKNDLSELFVLRLTFTFAGGFPLVLIQLYLALTEVELDLPWVVYASLVASVLSTTWAVASFRRSHETLGPGSVVLSWPGSLFRLLWRVGEIVSRVISLTLFASLYGEWVFLVLGFHWVVMLLCLSIPQAASGEWCGASMAQRVAFCLVTSYSYVFCYINLCTVRTAVWYTLYYVIMFLENGTLSIVWLTKSEEDSFTSRYLLVFVSTLAFFAAMVCLAVYYKYFHLAACPALTKPGVCVAKEGPGSCLSCRHSVCAAHSNPRHHNQQQQQQQQQSSYPGGWMSQYHSALTSGHYYKHTMHDSLLDSASDLASMTTAGSASRRLHPKLTVAEGREGGGVVDVAGLAFAGARAGRERCGCACREREDAGSVVSGQTSRSAASCPHRRCLKTSRSDLTDTTSVLTLASGASQNLGYEGSDETQSNTVPAWLPSGDSLIARHLLTPDSAQGGPAPECHRDHQRRQEKNMEHYRCLLRQEAQRWATDGYSTDQTVMEWSKLPVTPLGANVWGIQDPDSECYASCCCCGELSPGDSEVSSIFRASQRAHAGGCEGCDGCCCRCSGGEDVVYGVPTREALHHHHHHHHHHLHRKGHRKEASSSDSEVTCACCLQQRQGEGQGQQYHSQPNVFTISHRDDCRLADSPDSNGGGGRSGKQCVSDSEGVSRKQAGVLKKSRHPERRKAREQSGDRPVKKGTSPERRAAGKPRDADSESTGKSDPESIIRSEDRNAHKHTPSKLQVKAIAEKSDDDSPTKSKPSIFPTATSEPIYENVSVRIQQNQNQNKDLKTHTSNTTDGLLQNTTEKLDMKNSELRNEDVKDEKSQENEDVQSKANKDKELRTKRQQRSEEVRNRANKDKESAARRPETERAQKNGKSSRTSRPCRQLPGGRNDPWYVCSESEDSALPPETFSSSIDDGFTATDVDSDGSLELII